MPLHPSLALSVPDAAVMLNGGLLGVDMAQMQAAGPNRPRIVHLIRSGKLRYERADPGEHWQTYNELMGQLRRDGVAFGDCEDLAAAAAAEMRLDQGAPWYDPTARVYVYRSNPRVSHVVVHSQRFGLLDPSVGGGMGGLRSQPRQGADLAGGLPYPRPPGYHEGRRFPNVASNRGTVRMRFRAVRRGTWGRR